MVRENRKARAAALAKAGCRPATGVVVDEEQRRRLAECCAFFLASRFRPAHPGEYRKRDRTRARASVDAIIRKHAPK